MSGWVEAFIVIAAVAIVVQAGIMVALYVTVQRTTSELTRAVNKFQGKIDPILTRTSKIFEDSETRIATILTDATEISNLSRSQVQKIDRVFTDAVERLRLQIVRADQILTGTLEVVEDAGNRVKRSIWEPVHRASALIKGVKAGLEYFKNQSGGSGTDGSHQDEELFI